MRLKETIMNPIIISILCFLSAMALLAYSLSGCARVQVGDASYTRIGSQNLDVTLVMSDGTRIEMKQNSQTEALQKILDIAKGLVK